MNGLRPEQWQRIQEAVTGRSSSFFGEDLLSTANDIAALVEGKHVLVAGAAGTIGRATIQELIPYAPRILTLVDVNENGLTELVRDLRNNFATSALPQLRPRLLDITASYVDQLAGESDPPSVMMNFAAVKHVRSERDEFSLRRMFEVNVLGMRNLVRLAGQVDAERIFSVSTDKAARPSSLMGASKAVMEAVLLQTSVVPASSARFANVAFSEGSLLRSWLDRLARGEPWPAPRDTRRYFVSIEEAGQLCLIAACLPDSGLVSIPKLGPDFVARDLAQCAQDAVTALGLEARIISDVTRIRDSSGGWQKDNGSVGILLTPRDTEGEKEVEEFVGAGDEVKDIALGGLQALTANPLDREKLDDFIEWLDSPTDGPKMLPSKGEYLEHMRSLLPDFAWTEAAHVLDDRL